jgi:hypothetical protein
METIIVKFAAWLERAVRTNGPSSALSNAYKSKDDHSSINADHPLHPRKLSLADLLALTTIALLLPDGSANLELDTLSGEGSYDPSA